MSFLILLLAIFKDVSCCLPVKSRAVIRLLLQSRDVNLGNCAKSKLQILLLLQSSVSRLLQPSNFKQAKADPPVTLKYFNLGQWLKSRVSSLLNEIITVSSSVRPSILKYSNGVQHSGYSPVGSQVVHLMYLSFLLLERFNLVIQLNSEIPEINGGRELLTVRCSNSGNNLIQEPP